MKLPQSLEKERDELTIEAAFQAACNNHVSKEDFDAVANKIALAVLSKAEKLAEAFDNLLCEISEPAWTDERMNYEERQVTKGAVESANEALAEWKAFRGEG